MSAHPQLAASPDEIHYWTQSDWWPVWLVLERWGVPEPQCLEAKRQALLSACERGQVQWRRSDGKPYDDPIHELAARNRVLIERSSLMAWSRTLPERRRGAVPALPSWANVQAAAPTVQPPAAGLAAALVQKGLPSRGMQHYSSYWRPDLVASWLIDKGHMSRQRAIHILQTRFPEWADLADYL